MFDNLKKKFYINEAMNHEMDLNNKETVKHLELYNPTLLAKLYRDIGDHEKCFATMGILNKGFRYTNISEQMLYTCIQFQMYNYGLNLAKRFVRQSPGINRAKCYIHLLKHNEPYNDFERLTKCINKRCPEEDLRIPDWIVKETESRFGIENIGALYEKRRAAEEAATQNIGNLEEERFDSKYEERLEESMVSIFKNIKGLPYSVKQEILHNIIFIYKDNIEIKVDELDIYIYRNLLKYQCNTDMYVNILKMILECMKEEFSVELYKIYFLILESSCIINGCDGSQCKDPHIREILSIIDLEYIKRMNYDSLVFMYETTEDFHFLDRMYEINPYIGEEYKLAYLRSQECDMDRVIKNLQLRFDENEYKKYKQSGRFDEVVEHFHTAHNKKNVKFPGLRKKKYINRIHVHIVTDPKKLHCILQRITLRNARKRKMRYYKKMKKFAEAHQAKNEGKENEEKE